MKYIVKINDFQFPFDTLEQAKEYLLSEGYDLSRLKEVDFKCWWIDKVKGFVAEIIGRDAFTLDQLFKLYPKTKQYAVYEVVSKMPQIEAINFYETVKKINQNWERKISTIDGSGCYDDIVNHKITIK